MFKATLTSNWFRIWKLRCARARAQRNFQHYLTNIPLMKGTVPKRLDICYDFGTFNNIFHFYFLLVVPSAPQHTKFLTSFMFWVRIDYFTVVCLVAWPLNECEAGVDLLLIETSLLLLCNFIPISMRSASLKAFLFPRLLGKETIQAQERWRNWRGVLSDGNRKWAVFLFNLSSHCCIYIVKYFSTRRDD